MCCKISIPCHNPLASTFAETCYTGTTINTLPSTESLYIIDNGPASSAAGALTLTGGTDFANITQIDLNYTKYWNASHPGGIDTVNGNNVWVNAVQVGDILIVIDSTNALLYGRYEVTNITTHLNYNSFDVTFISGNGTINSIGNVPTPDKFFSVTYNTPIPNFETKTIFQLNTPGEDEEVCKDLFTLCDFVSSVTVPCGDFEYPLGGIRITEFVYWDSETEEYTTTVTDFFVGFTFQDINGDPITLDAECDITICFNQEQQISTTIEQFKLKLLYLQKSYSDKVLKVIKKLQFGYNCVKELNDLKVLKDTLVLLNEYDTRDITLGDTIYNSITYEEIKTIIYKLR